jgi:hypothetical protein
VKKLIVTGDDFGLTSGVVAGILMAHQKGILTSASLMANAPAADEAFRAAREYRTLSVGLHFVLTFGHPIGPPDPIGSLLKPDGSFLRLESGAHARVESSDVRPELEAQLLRFTKEVERLPAHIDGHHHVHTQPGVLEAVIAIARKKNLPVRAPDDKTRDTLIASGVKTTGAFIDRFYGEGAISEGEAIAIIESLTEGTNELMCHPAVEYSELKPLSGYTHQRCRELETLTAPSVREAIDRFGIELIPSSGL